MTFIHLMMAILIPYSSAFESTNDFLTNNLDFLILAVFSVDMIFAFSTGYYEEGILIMYRTQIASNYLKLWFWIDIFSTIPFNLIINCTSQKHIQILRCLATSSC